MRKSEPFRKLEALLVDFAAQPKISEDELNRVHRMTARRTQRGLGQALEKQMRAPDRKKDWRFIGRFFRAYAQHTKVLVALEKRALTEQAERKSDNPSNSASSSRPHADAWPTWGESVTTGESRLHPAQAQTCSAQNTVVPDNAPESPNPEGERTDPAGVLTDKNSEGSSREDAELSRLREEMNLPWAERWARRHPR